MNNKDIPEGFIPFVTIGELDGYLMVYTAESHENTVDIIQRTLDVMTDSDENQEMTLQ
jgi:hypothetical protein